MQDFDGTFDWTGQWSNGMTRARYDDNPNCAVFAWDNQNEYLEFVIEDENSNWTDSEFLSFRACQITRHPLNQNLEDDEISFDVTLMAIK